MKLDIYNQTNPKLTEYMKTNAARGERSWRGTTPLEVSLYTPEDKNGDFLTGAGMYFTTIDEARAVVQAMRPNEGGQVGIVRLYADMSPEGHVETVAHEDNLEVAETVEGGHAEDIKYAFEILQEMLCENLGYERMRQILFERYDDNENYMTKCMIPEMKDVEFKLDPESVAYEFYYKVMSDVKMA